MNLYHFTFLHIRASAIFSQNTSSNLTNVSCFQISYDFHEQNEISALISFMPNLEDNKFSLPRRFPRHFQSAIYCPHTRQNE